MNKSDNDEEKTYVIERGGSDKKSCKKDEVRRLIQNVIGNSVNLLTLIGSGASLPAINLMGNTFKKYRKNLKNEDPKLSEHLEKSIETICKNHKRYDAKKFDNIEFFLSWLKYRIDGDADTSKMDEKLFVDIKQHFIDSVKCVTNEENQVNVTKVDSNYLKVVQGLGKSRQILARQQKTVFDIVNLFTTNYDLFHERALELSHYAYTDGFTNGINNTFSDREFHRRPIDLEDRFKDKLQPVNPFFRLLKLHGSINWEKKENKVIRVSNGNFNNESNNDLEKVLISPTSSKFALTQDEPYSDLFREFVNIMAIPNSVLFTSAFSFNDSHIARLIENALDRTDFTLYAFIGDYTKDNSNSNFSKFIKRISKSPNVFLIYIDGESVLPFDDFAYFMQPDVMDNVEEMNDEKKKENNND